MLKIDYDTYLASSSGEESGTSGEGGGGAKNRPQGQGVKVPVIVGCCGGWGGWGGWEGGEEVMEITWEPGLREDVREMVKRRQGAGQGAETTWQQYQKEKKAQKKRVKV